MNLEKSSVWDSFSKVTSFLSWMGGQQIDLEENEIQKDQLLLWQCWYKGRVLYLWVAFISSLDARIIGLQ